MVLADDYHYAENYPLRPLEDDCQLLGDLLDDCLKIEIGEELFEKVCVVGWGVCVWEGA